MSDSGRQIGDCRHGHGRAVCHKCLQRKLDLQKRFDVVVSHCAVAEAQVEEYQHYVGGIWNSCEHENRGADLCATKLRDIAENGRASGVFGGEEVEKAAQAILKLRAENAELREALAAIVAWQSAAYSGPGILKLVRNAVVALAKESDD